MLGEEDNFDEVNNVFTEAITYSIPKYDTLRAQFAASAQISADGRSVTVGQYTAKKLSFGRGWKAKTDDGLFIVFGTNARSNMINNLATSQARAQITVEDRKAALAAVLETKLASLKGSPA